MLHTYRRFTIPAFSPCLLNIALIAGAYIAAKSMPEPVYGLAVAVLVGGVLQLAVQFIPIVRLGTRFRWPKTWWHPGVRKMGRLLVPRIMGAGVYQLTVLIDTFCASLSHIVGAGGISAIYYSNRIIQFPMGIFSVAMASAVLPSLSGMAQKRDLHTIKKTIVFSLENIFFVMCPTTVILLLLGKPIIRVLFERGEFTAHSTEITSLALVFYAIGLFSFGGIKILVTAFHALQDTMTPVKVAAGCLFINAALNFTLMFPLKIGGIALASAIAGTVDFLILFAILDRRLGRMDGELFMYFLKVAFIAAITGIIEFTGWYYLDIPNETVKLIFIGTFGILFYFLMGYLLGIPQARKFVHWALSLFRT